LPKRSAGLLLFRIKPAGVEVLLVHPGGPFWAKKDDGAWSIPKGELSEAEEPLAAARREFEEEMGRPVDGEFLPLEPIRQAGGKEVLAWAVRADVDPATLDSNTFSMEWPPHSGRQQQFPEIDKAAWFDLGTAKQKILKGQAPLLDELSAKVKMDKDREQRFVFDEVAELYARVRPTYPRALIDDVIRAARLSPGSRILEIGSGPGNASVQFAGRGFRLLCLEPGRHLAEVARRRLAEDAHAQVVETTFEHWPLEAGAFDLVFAAQSFHWIDPDLRFSKTAQTLKRDGALAIFANQTARGTTPLDLRIQQVYAAHAPEIDARWHAHNTRDYFLDMFAASSEFQPAQCREYEWRAEYRTAAYLDLVQTHSDHRLLDRERLEAVLNGIGDAIDSHGGSLVVNYVAVLCWAQRVPA
jgi:predicted NUDIX family NTP pyrophosphohydrolase/ubiquinone/menaquinone biosynthesis C-methylase UbiE